MEKSPFSRFIELITFDQSFGSIEQQLEEAITLLDTLLDQMAEVDRQYEKERLAVQDLRKEVDAQELEMRILDEREKAARERSALASTSQEYQAFKRECDQLKQLQHEHEDVLVSAWSTFEQAQKQFEAKEAAYREKKAQLEEQVDACEQKKQDLLTQLANREETRKAYLTDIPEEWLEKYNRMRNTVSNPVVPVIEGTCGGCASVLAQPFLMALDLNKMVQCPGCYRLLYKNFEQPAAPASS